MELRKNRFKQALKEGVQQIGLWTSLCSNISTELISYSGFDWIVLDMEHAHNELPDIISQIQAMGTSNSSAVVRPPWNDMVVIKRLLDAGAQTILIPYVQNAEEAQYAVDAVHYPPKGVRGVAGGSRASAFGRMKNYLHRANEEICLLLQVETIEALDQLEAILEIEGVDGIFIGPSDLSASMGHLGNADHPDVQSAIARAHAILSKTKVASGILGVKTEHAQKYIDMGFDFVAVGTDAGLLAAASDALCARFKAE